MRLGARLGLDAKDLATLYDVGILTYVGCPAEVGGHGEIPATGVAASSPNSCDRALNHGTWSAQVPISLQGRSASTQGPVAVGPSIASITANTDTASRATASE